MIPIQFNQHLRSKKVCLLNILITFCATTHVFAGQVSQRSRPLRATAGTRLAEAIAAEKLDEYGLSCRRFTLPQDAKVSAKRKRPTTNESRGRGDTIDTDTEDKTFTASVSEGGSDDNSPDSDSDGIEIGNEEVRLLFS